MLILLYWFKTKLNSYIYIFIHEALNATGPNTLHSRYFSSTTWLRALASEHFIAIDLFKGSSPKNQPSHRLQHLIDPKETRFYNDFKHSLISTRDNKNVSLICWVKRKFKFVFFFYFSLFPFVKSLVILKNQRIKCIRLHYGLSQTMFHDLSGPTNFLSCLKFLWRL